jgi:hypothetical protein
MSFLQNIFAPVTYQRVHELTIISRNSEALREISRSVEELAMDNSINMGIGHTLSVNGETYRLEHDETALVTKRSVWFGLLDKVTILIIRS